MSCVCRGHLYGDVYSSPGLDMQQKQVLMVAFLGQANMPDELYGHALAVSTTGFPYSSCYKCYQYCYD